MNKPNKNEMLRQVQSRLSMREPLAKCLSVIADLTNNLSLKKRPANPTEQKAFLAGELDKACEIVPSLKGFERTFPSFTCLYSCPQPHALQQTPT